MPISLKSIPGICPKKYKKTLEQETHPFFVKGFNKCIDQMGEVQITLNREKLAEIISQHVYGKKELQYPLCETIIANLSEIIEVIKEDK